MYVRMSIIYSYIFIHMCVYLYLHLQGTLYLCLYLYRAYVYTFMCFCLTLYQSLLRPKVYTTMPAHGPFGMPRSTQKGFPPTGG